MRNSRRRIVLLLTALVWGYVAIAPAPATATATAARRSLQVKVLSNRADLISGGDALVEIVLPTGVSAAPSGVLVDVDGRDVTAAFGVRADGRFYGRVEGLALGANQIRARLRGGGAATITVTNHAIGGPVFAGPQVQPWICDTDGAGLGPPQDAQCNGNTIVEFFYMPAGLSLVSDGGTSHSLSAGNTVGGFQPYDPSNPPPSATVGTTTTDQGITVPYIVRRETGTVDRGVYQIAVLYDPATPFEPWAPQPGWNHKLEYLFGPNCAPDHQQHTAGQEVLQHLPLSRGFAVASSSLNVMGQNCNDVVAAEAMMMVKERLIERYGLVRYTFGDGCSGGAQQQYLIADNYPGLLDGLRPACSFPDGANSSVLNDVDCALLLNYFQNTSPQLWAAPHQRGAVEGFVSESVCLQGENAAGSKRKNKWDPTVSCLGGLGSGPPLDEPPPDWVYNAETNPGGARCTWTDYMISVFGARAADGFANRPVDNIGVQYGLDALNAGIILPEQFVDLNASVGGLDIDGQFQAERSVGDPLGVERLYTTGRSTYGRGWAKVPVIDVRTYETYDQHPEVMPDVIEARLRAANGNADNLVRWEALIGAANVSAPSVFEASFLLMDRWLAAIEADTSGDALETKVVRNKPADAADGCWVGPAHVARESTCGALPHFETPRMAAGMPITADVYKCALKPLEPADYAVVFTADQWARLQAAYPDGVCDWTRPGVGQQPPAGDWLTFAGGPGGQPLGPPPTSRS